MVPLLMRRFIRHPVCVPIEVSLVGGASSGEAPQASDLGAGGLAFGSNQKFEPGMLVHIRISHTQPVFETDAKVVWCRNRQQGTEVGVAFLNEDDAFKARMVEQVCHIENYKHAVRRNEGRSLTTQEAAIEWVSKFAANFPR
jgi:hypothetical protein